MANTAATYPGTGANEARSGSDGSWSDSSNITTESNNATALVGKLDYSDWLRASNFGFAVPTGATIDGVKVEIRRAHSSPNQKDIVDSSVRLVDEDGSNIGDDKASATAWAASTTFETAEYGGPTDTWGATLTPAIINDTDFGIRFSSYNGAASATTFYVAWIKITVYYTVAGTLVNPSPASLSVTSYAPNPLVSDNKRPEPVTASLAMTTYASSIALSDNAKVIPTPAALEATYYTPSLVMPIVVTQRPYKYFLPCSISPDDIDGLLNGFPVCIQIKASAGKNSKDLTPIIDELGANNLKMAIYYGQQQCFVEVATWDTTNKYGELHVRLSEVSNAVATEFILFFGSSSADNSAYVGLTGSVPAQNVWDSNFVFVSHMNDNPAGDGILDSTSNENHGTKGAAPANPTEVDGLVGKAQSFDGTNDVINLPIISGVTTSSYVEFLFDRIGISQSGVTGYTTLIGSNISRRLLITDYLGYALAQAGSSHRSDVGILTVAAHDWQVVGYKHNGTTGSWYIDGVNKGDSNYSPYLLDLSTASYKIGSYGSDAYWFNGLISEVRLSSTARDGGWIAATNKSLRDELVTYGDIQEVVTKLEITTYIPIIGHGSLVSPAAAELELTTYAVEVDTTKNWRLTPGAAELVLTTYPPKADTSIVVTPATASLVLLSYVPDAIVNHIVIASTAELALSTYIPEIKVSDNQLVTPGTAQLALETFAPTLYQHIIITPIAAELVLTTFAPYIIIPSRSIKIFGYTKPAFEIIVYTVPHNDIFPGSL